MSLLYPQALVHVSHGLGLVLNTDIFLRSSVWMNLVISDNHVKPSKLNALNKPEFNTLPLRVSLMVFIFIRPIFYWFEYKSCCLSFILF